MLQTDMDKLKIMDYLAVVHTRWAPWLGGSHGRHGTHLQTSSAKRNQGNVDVIVTLQQYLSIQRKVVPKNGGIETVTDHAIMTFKDL